MPIELTDDKGNPLDLDKADGSTLRKKLEQALEENKNLAQENATFKATDVIGKHGFSLVKPEDLSGVAADQIEAKAKELQEQREGERTEMVRSVLQGKGLEGPELDKAVEDFLSGSTQTPPESTEPDFTDLAGLGGERPTRNPNLPPLDDPMGNLVGAFEE